MRLPQGKKWNALKIAAGFAVTVLLTVFSARSLGSLNPARLLSAPIRWGWAGAAGLLFAGATWVRGLCYTKGIAPGLDPMSAWRVTAVGNALNMLLPFKMGDGLRLALFPRGYGAMRRLKLTLVPAAADMACILAGGVCAALFTGFGSPRMIRLLAGATLLVAVACAAVCVVVPFVPRADAAARALPRRRLGAMFVWVAVSWAMMFGSVQASLFAAGFPPGFAPRAALFLFAALNFVSLVPGSPGAVGVFEYTAARSLQTMGATAAQSLNAALLLHVTQYLSLVPLGIVLWVAPMLPRRDKNTKIRFS